MNKFLKANLLKAILVTTTLLNVFTTLSIPIFNMLLIDEGIIAKNWDVSIKYLVLILIGLLIIDILAGFNYYLSRYIEVKDGFKLQENLNKKIFQLKNLDNSSEYLPVFTTDIESMKIKNTSIISLLNSIVKLILILSLLYILDPEMVMISFLLILLIPIIPFILSFKLPVISNDILEKKSYFTNFISEILKMTKEIRLDFLEMQEREIFSRKLNDTLPSILKFHFLNAIFNSNNIIYTLFYFIIMYISIEGIFNGSFTLGELTAVIAFLGYTVNPINEIIMNYNRLKMVKGSSERYKNIFEKKVLRQNTKIINGFKNNKKILEVRNIISNKISNAVSFDMHVGEWILIYGESGKGKTSILNILTMLDFEYKGSIIYKNNNIENFNKIDYLKSFVYVLQNHQIYNLAIINNEMMNIQNYEKFKSYLKRLRVYHVLKNNYQISSLSGGEKQRLLIALALEKNPEVLILDEPTSALDQENTELVISLLREVRDNKSTIIVSHNASFNFIPNKVHIS